MGADTSWWKGELNIMQPEVQTIEARSRRERELKKK